MESLTETMVVLLSFSSLKIKSYVLTLWLYAAGKYGHVVSLCTATKYVISLFWCSGWKVEISPVVNAVS